MTEQMTVWKVVRRHRDRHNLFFSAIVYDTPWARVYEPNEPTTFPSDAPGLAFEKEVNATLFRRANVMRHLTELWKCDAAVLPDCPQKLLATEELCLAENDRYVRDFWRSDDWKGRKGLRAPYIYAPRGTVACLSITLLERCDD